MRMLNRAEHKGEEKNQIEDNELISDEERRIPIIIEILREQEYVEDYDSRDYRSTANLLKIALNEGRIIPQDLENHEVRDMLMKKFSQLLSQYEKIDDPEVRSRYKRAIEELRGLFKLPDSIFLDENIKHDFQDAAIRILKNDNKSWDDEGREIDETIRKLNEIKSLAATSDIFEEPEVYLALKDKIIKLLEDDKTYLDNGYRYGEKYEYDSDLRRLIGLKDFFNLPIKYFQQDQDYIKRLTHTILKEIKQGYYNFEIYSDNFGVGMEYLPKEELLQSAKEGVMSILNHDNTHISDDYDYYRDESLELINELIMHLSLEKDLDIAGDGDLRQAAIRKVKSMIEADIRIYFHAGNQESSSFREAAKIMTKFNIPAEEISQDPVIRETVKKKIIETLTGGIYEKYHSEIYEESREVLCFGKEFYDDEGLKKAAKDYFTTILSMDIIQKDTSDGRDSDETVYLASRVKENLMLGDDFYHDEKIQKLAKEKIERLIKSAQRYKDYDGEFHDSDFSRAKMIKEHFGVADNILSKEVLDELLKNQDNNSYVDEINDYFEKDLVEKAKFFKLKLSEAYVGGYDPDIHKDDEKEDRFRIYFSTLEISHKDWQDPQNIGMPFKIGAKHFGYERMFNYIYRPGLSRHDALHNFRRIELVMNASGLSPEKFYHNILAQVAKDDSNYEEGTAHHKLNSLANNISLEFDSVIENAKQYSAIPRMQELLSGLDSPEKIFGSWKMLKKYEEISNLLKSKEILLKLQLLKAQGKEKLSRYIETLAFHPNISMDKVMQFWQKPEAFLDTYDSHTPNEVHNSKKPSNYFNIPNLDMTAEELRDALVEGDIDKLQAIRPMEMSYIFNPLDGSCVIDSVAGSMSLAFGKKREDKKGLAFNPGKLYQKIAALFKEKKVRLNRAAYGEIVPGFLDLEYEGDEAAKEFLLEYMGPEEADDMLKKIRSLLDDNNIGLDRKILETFRAKVNLKSDPDGVVAGNDTTCCMPFGSGKNNVYTFNPICAQFTMQKRLNNGNWRTVTQSVLTKNKDIKKNVANIVETLRSRKSKMQDVVDEEVLIESPSILTCDNIETAPNFKSDPNSEKIIKTVYSNFFSEYMARFAEEDGFDPNRIIIGKGFTDSMTSLPSVTNTFIPEAPIGYSDNLGETSYILNLEKGGSQPTRYRKPEHDTSEQDSLRSKGIKPLTFRDTLAVSYIEGKAYADNQDLVEYLHNMENALIAKDINNTIKNRPNMSFKYRGSEGKVHGYMLAYEGRRDKRGERVLYITDLATDGQVRAGGSLMLNFAKAYKTNYLKKNNPIPILAQLREKTSYKLIMKNLKKLSDICGTEFEMQELDTYKVGDDTMHEVMLIPKE
jgi:hypothetical protein